MKWGRDFWAVSAIVLLLFCIMQQAVLCNAMEKLEDKLAEIYETARQQQGWVYIELEKDK